MQERLVLVNHLSTGSIARRLLFHMVTTKPSKFVFKNELLTNIVSWGNFGHGATSVKKSLRNHFGRINNV